MSQTPPTPNAPKSPNQGDSSPSLLYGGSDDRIIQGHKYDGIREYDNPMPGWWVWIFIVTVIFGPIYVFGVHFSDVIPTYEERLASAQADLVETRMAYATANPGLQTDPRALEGYIGDEAMMAVGQELFTANCAVCHGQQGEGLIGPNLTDAYWVHGNDPEDIFRVINEGVLEKGMTPWEGILTAEERVGVMAYVKSLEGTDVPGGKAPEGELVN